MLHNICKDRNLGVNEDDGEDDEVAEGQHPQQAQPNDPRRANEGLRYRDAYVDLNYK